MPTAGGGVTYYLAELLPKSALKKKKNGLGKGKFHFASTS